MMSLLWTIRQLEIVLEQYDKMRDDRSGLSFTQQTILGYLYRQGERPVYAVHLHRQTGLSKAAISAQLRQLKKKGYLETLPEQADERKKRLMLTPLAKRAKADILASLRQNEIKLFADIPEEQLRRTEETLQKMTDGIRRQMERSALHDQDPASTGKAI